jgi:hypothetical protein
MGTKIDLVENKVLIIHLVARLLNEMINLPGITKRGKGARNKINVLLQEMGTENKISSSIYKLEEKLPDFSGRAIEPLGDFALIENEEFEDSKFPNAVTVDVEINGVKFQARVSGLTKKENTCVAVILLARASNSSVGYILFKIKENKMSNYPFKKKNYPLLKILVQEDEKDLDDEKM